MWKAIAALVIILLMVAVYDSIAVRLRPDPDLTAANELADSLRAERDSYKRGLEDANVRVSDLETTVADTKRDNQELRADLDRSLGISGDLAAENRRLEQSISEGLSETSKLGISHTELGGTIDRLGDIFDRYTGGTEGE